jgi:diacylglycerol kinase family enzyme
MRVVLVANGRSGAADRVGDAEKHLQAAGAEVSLLGLEAFCDGPDAVDEERLALEAGRLRARAGVGAVGDGHEHAGAERIVVAGGDGSIGPAALLALRSGLPLAVLPIGTANSFARWLGLPLDLEEAAALAASPDPVLRRAEVADAGGRPFVNVAACGLSVLAADQARPFKRRLGPLAYALGALRAAISGRPLHAAVACDGEEAWRGAAWQILVAATGAFGGESSTGGVDPTDRRLDVAIVPAGPRAELVRRGYAMRQGRLVDDEGVVHVRGRTVELELGTARFNVDGEILDVAPARFGISGTFEVVAG